MGPNVSEAINFLTTDIIDVWKEFGQQWKFCSCNLQNAAKVELGLENLFNLNQAEIMRSDVKNEIATVGEFVCPDCKKKFSTKFNLKSHKQSVHVKLKFKCENCLNEYSKKSNLTRHICKTKN